VLRSIRPGLPQDPDKVLAIARDWWTAEIRASEDFLLKRDQLKKRGAWNGNYYSRPKLRDVLAALEGFKHESAGI
jgi:hypothetical protein